MQNPNNLSAVEFLVEHMINKMQIRIENTEIGIKLLQEAKEMEKQQIIDAWKDGLFGSLRKGEDNAEQYYNETFKNK